MDMPISTNSLLFNDLFIRSLLLIPLALSIYVLLTVYKQHDNKFKNVSLIKDNKKADQEPEDTLANC
ncbi:hypothetical protein CL658_03180 [bacterium]|nr:hypothetical protein [bacterium]